MVQKTYNILFLFLILFLSILALFYIPNKKEAFTPGIRKFVRPHLRNMRITTDEYKDALKDQSGKLFNMFGLQFA